MKRVGHDTTDIIELKIRNNIIYIINKFTESLDIH